MESGSSLHEGKAGQPTRAREYVQKLEFAADRTFQTELRRRVDEYFKTTGRRERDCWPMYLKTAVFLACFVGSYALLVFAARTLWQALPLAVLLGLSMAAIGFNIQHDGGHKAYSNRAWVNRLMAGTMDLIGGSSFFWRWKHVMIHHMYVNITDWDSDLDLGGLARLTPHQKRLPIHRWQHIYLWPLYGLLAIKWQLVSDFVHVTTGRFGVHRIPRPKGWDLVTFIAGKAIFAAWAFVVPMLLHPVGVVLFYYAVALLVLGMALSIVFQLPHCVGQADFPVPRPDTGRMEKPWAVHQASVTLDFCRPNPVLRWVLGGLNFHLEHHLFPLVCHINYPGISKIVEQTCRDFGVKYAEHKTFWAGIVAHYRWLRQMGAASTDATRAPTEARGSR